MYSHIVFDVDGTLVDSEGADLYSLRDTLLEIQGKEYPPDELQFALGIPSEYALEKLGVSHVEHAGAIWRAHYLKYLNTLAVFDGIPATLKELTGASRVLGIVTSRTTAEYENDILPFGLSHFFSCVVCADDTERHKPCPDPMIKYLERSGAAPASALYVGDTVYDMRCAHAAGVDFALALWGGKRWDGCEAEHYFSHPQNILDMLDR